MQLSCCSLLAAMLYSVAVFCQVRVSTFDSLKKYCRIPGSNIRIVGNITLKDSISIRDNVHIDGGGFTVSSKLFFTTLRDFASLNAKGSNIRIENLSLTGADCDVRNTDTMLYQTGIRVFGENFTLVRCTLSCWGWAAVYGYRMQGTVIDSCSFSYQRNMGYGYGYYSDAIPGQSATIRNCSFSNNVAGVDAGGQATYLLIQNCVTDAPFTCHKSGNGLGYAGLIVEGCTFIGCNSNFPAPQDEGYLIVRNNFYTKDSTALGLKSANANARIEFSSNTFNYKPAVALTIHLKTSARFTPKGYFQVQIFIDDTMRYKADAASLWKWTEVSIPVRAAEHRIHLRLEVMKDAPYSCLLWLDKINVPDGDFENGSRSWRQLFTGQTAGSGITSEDFFEGKYSWRFEYRVPELNPNRVVIPRGSSATLYQSFVID